MTGEAVLRRDLVAAIDRERRMPVLQRRIHLFNVAVFRRQSEQRRPVNDVGRRDVNVIVEDDHPVWTQRRHAVIADDHVVHAIVEPDLLDARDDIAERCVDLHHRLLHIV